MKEFVEKALKGMEEEYYKPSCNHLHLFASALYDIVEKECGYGAVDEVKINLYRRTIFRDKNCYDEFKCTATLQFYFDYLDNMSKNHTAGDDIFNVEVREEEIFVYTGLWYFA